MLNSKTDAEIFQESAFRKIRFAENSQEELFYHKRKWLQSLFLRPVLIQPLLSFQRSMHTATIVGNDVFVFGGRNHALNEMNDLLRLHLPGMLSVCCSMCHDLVAFVVLHERLMQGLTNR